MKAVKLLRWQMLSLLPDALIILLVASLGSAQRISGNDAFRAIAVTVTKPEPLPVCSLQPLTPPDPLNEQVLLSFEDWKKKQRAGQQEEFLKETVEDNQTLTLANKSNASTRNASAPLDVDVSAGHFADGLQTQDIAPHFRVPITDRFNYANVDCSARVHTSHRSAKSPSSILSFKKDRYMLSPCNSGREKQFVVVELCDDIRIDTVQLANFEFFSGVFKDFTVSVAKTYSVDPDGWTLAGTYKAKNVRGVQSFHLPTALRDFYRFIRIDFLSHYGNEYYCPISLLRVYGLTHLEEWKWDIWQAESRAKLEKEAIQITSTLHPVDNVSETHDGRVTQSVVELTAPQEPDVPSTIADAPTSTRIPAAAATQIPTEADGIESVIEGIVESSPVFNGSSRPSEAPQHFSQSQTSLQSPTSTHISASSASTLSHTIVLESPEKSHEILSSLSDAHYQTQVQSSNHSTIDIPSSTIIPAMPSGLTSSFTVQPQPPPPPVPPAGESIYRTIMNRLIAVENNQTLYMKYVEQQNGAIRDVIRRLGEDVGRLEGITRAQGLTLQKAVNDWEKQRYQLQMEYKDILRRMEILTHEIIIEKRLGVAQLCLLLAVLIFLGLTRGSRANELLSSREIEMGGLKEWGRRHLSWTGDRRKLVGKSTEVGDREGSKKGSQNRSHDGMWIPDTKTPVKRPKPLILNASNILRTFSEDAGGLKLPFPSSEQSSHRTTGSTLARPRRRTISHSRSRAHSGTATPLFSAPVTGSVHGSSRRMAFQRPVTPSSRSHFVFRTPQGVHRSHSFSRSTTPIGSAGGLVRGPTPLPMSQTSSWGGTFGVVPKSARNFARSSHLHDVRSAKKRQERERIESAMSKVKIMGSNLDVEEDIFLGPLKKSSSNSVLMQDDTKNVVSSQRLGLLLGIPQDIELQTTWPLVLPVEDDPWVDTDSASVDGFDLSPIAPSSSDVSVLPP